MKVPTASKISSYRCQRNHYTASQNLNHLLDEAQPPATFVRVYWSDIFIATKGWTATFKLEVAIVEEDCHQDPEALRNLHRSAAETMYTILSRKSLNK